MGGPGLILAKAAAALLANDDGQKAIGWLVVAIFLPLLLIAAFLCSAVSGGADHNNLAVEASFYDTSYTESIPEEFQEHITEMRTAFSRLDAAVQEANVASAEGGGLDPIQVKAVFYALCFGEEAPSRREARQFVSCFYGKEERVRTVEAVDEDGNVTIAEETYIVVCPLSLDRAYENLAVLLDRDITEENSTEISAGLDARIYLCATAISGAQRRKGEADEYQEAHRLQRHVRSAGYADDGRAAADEAVLRDRPAGQRQAGKRCGCGCGRVFAALLS